MNCSITGFAALALLTAPAFAQVSGPPNLLQYQGRLADLAGTAVDQAALPVG